MAWELRRLSTGEVLEGPKSLPENWGPIFGLKGFKDKLADLSWVGMGDKGWVEISPDPEPVAVKPESAADVARKERNNLLSQSDWAMMSDVAMAAGTKDNWTEYRRLLRDITLQASFPDDITWPNKPE